MRAGRVGEPVIAGIGVGLKDAGEAGEMALGVLPPAVWRGVVQRSRWRIAAERAVVADIGPDVAGDGLALGQDRDRGVVAERTFIVRDKRSLMQALGRQDMRFDEGVQRRKRTRAGADLIRQCRDAQCPSTNLLNRRNPL